MSDKKKNIFISNGKVHSQQAKNFEFNMIIDSISRKYPEVNIFVSNVSGLKIVAKNIFYTQDIIKKQGCDLNENAYISRFCELIVGRSSGAFTFAFCAENVFDESKNLLSFSNIKAPFWLGPELRDKVKYKASVENYDRYDMNFVLKKIEQKIDCLF